MAEGYTTQRLDHLGIVAGICREIGLAEQIDRIVGPTERQVSVGEAVQAMVLNALGFTSHPLCLTPRAFQSSYFSGVVSRATPSSGMAATRR